MTNIYMNKSYDKLKTYQNTNCLNATQIPCWTPIITWFIAPEMLSNMTKCPTIMDHNCESMILYYGLEAASKKCTRPCHSTHYKLISRGSNKLGSEKLDSVTLSGRIKMSQNESKLYFSSNHSSNSQQILSLHWNLQPTLFLCMKKWRFVIPNMMSLKICKITSHDPGSRLGWHCGISWWLTGTFPWILMFCYIKIPYEENEGI